MTKINNITLYLNLFQAVRIPQEYLNNNPSINSLQPEHHNEEPIYDTEGMLF